MNDRSADSDELMAAALTGELTPVQREAFDQLCADDADYLHEYKAIHQLIGRLDRADLQWEEHDLPAGLLERSMVAAHNADRQPVHDAAVHSSPQAPQAPAATGVSAVSKSLPRSDHHTPVRLMGAQKDLSRQPLRKWVVGSAAAGLLLIGALGATGTAHLLQRPPNGPPGTLGALESVALSGLPEGASIDADLVAHTWGTETILSIDGLQPGETYEVVLVSDAGQELSSGTFLGTDQTVHCRMNAAILRDDVEGLQIRESDGALVATSELPPT